MRSTNIYLAPRHFEWRDKNAVNLSEWVRNEIDAEIAKRNKFVKVYEITEWLARRTASEGPRSSELKFAWP